MSEEQQNHSSSHHDQDPLTSWLFGGKRQTNHNPNMNQWLFGRKTAPPAKDKESDQFQHLLNKINTEELFNNIDQLTEVAQEFKPLWKKISPHITKFIK
jgi:hypothetical protein